MPTAMITGASLGIGAAFAHRLASDGYDLILIARRPQLLNELAGTLRAAHGATIETLALDLGDPSARQAALRRATETDRPLDLLVNNVGVGDIGRFTEAEYAVLRAQLELNVGAALELTHRVLPSMIGRRRGDIINVASVAGLISGRGSTYAASKAWMIVFTEALSAQLRGTGVRVLALCPGFTHTDAAIRAGIHRSATPGGFWLEPEDVVDAALAGLRRDGIIAVPGLPYQVIVLVSRLIPRRVARILSYRYGWAK